MNIDYVAGARALTGVPFRAQGRDRSIGLDCVGLVLAVYDVPDLFRRNYRLRGDHLDEIRRALQRGFRRVGPGALRTGDLLLWRLARDQLHLGIAAGATFIHADAKLGRVVETPAPAQWPLVGVYRVRARRKGHSWQH